MLAGGVAIINPGAEFTVDGVDPSVDSINVGVEFVVNGDNGGREVPFALINLVAEIFADGVNPSVGGINFGVEFVVKGGCILLGASRARASGSSNPEVLF